MEVGIQILHSQWCWLGSKGYYFGCYLSPPIVFFFSRPIYGSGISILVFGFLFFFSGVTGGKMPGRMGFLVFLLCQMPGLVFFFFKKKRISYLVHTKWRDGLKPSVLLDKNPGWEKYVH